MGISWGCKPTNMVIPCGDTMFQSPLRSAPAETEAFEAFPGIGNYGHWGPTHGILIVKYVKTPNFLGDPLGFSHWLSLLCCLNMLEPSLAIITIKCSAEPWPSEVLTGRSSLASSWRQTLRPLRWPNSTPSSASDAFEQSLVKESRPVQWSFKTWFLWRKDQSQGLQNQSLGYKVEGQRPKPILGSRFVLGAFKWILYTPLPVPISSSFRCLHALNLFSCTDYAGLIFFSHLNRNWRNCSVLHVPSASSTGPKQMHSPKALGCDSSHSPKFDSPPGERGSSST